MCLLFFQRIGGGGWPRLPIENAIVNNLGSSTLATYGPLSEYNLDSVQCSIISQMIAK